MELTDKRLESVADTKPTPEEDMIAKENTREIMSKLSKKQKEMIKLIQEGYTRKEISVKFKNKGRSGIDVMFWRIRKKIKRKKTYNEIL